jgi:sec-independent protein translocase protein TatB
MFDVGFSELVVIGVVALVVIGPERLPRVARTAGLLFGRFQRYVSNVKADIQREMDSADLGKLRNEVQDAARSIEESVNQQAQSVESEARALQESLEEGARAEAATQTAPDALETVHEAGASPVPAADAAPAQQQLDLAIEPPYSPPSTRQKQII